MKKEYTERVPQWYNENDKKFDLILSDDIDGLLTTSLLHYVIPNWEVNYFYDFNKLYAIDEIFAKENKSRTRVWCDVSILENEMSFDNHVARIDANDFYNPLAINPNIFTDVTNENYTSKYCGSTALVVWSLYNLPLPKTEEGKMILLAIDSTFRGYYSDRFRPRNKFYLCDVLNMPELYEVQERHTKHDFLQVIAKHEISRKVIYDNENRRIVTELDMQEIGKLLDVELKLPEKKFRQCIAFEQGTCNLAEYDSVKEIHNRIATLAITHRNEAKYSYWLAPQA